MNRIVFCAAALLFIGACALPQLPTPDIGPVVDTAGTAETILKTAVVQTLTAQPTGTSTPVLSTATATVILDASASPTAIPETGETATTVIEAASPEATGTFDVPTATEFPATQLPVSGTVTRTPGVLTYGTLPPAVPFSNITLINRAKTQAYISLQVTTAEGGPTILEYPVQGQIKIKAPIGHYKYVAWVGGRQRIGEFRLHRDEDLEIILYRDRIEIK